MKKIVSLLLYLTVFVATSANESDYYQRAQTAFAEGKYADALKLYEAAHVLDNVNTDSLQAYVKVCLDAQTKARQAKAAGKDHEASTAYNAVLYNNPNDTEAKRFIDYYQQKQAEQARAAGELAAEIKAREEQERREREERNRIANSWLGHCFVIDLGNGNQLAVQKEMGPLLTYDEAYCYARNSKIGGFTDWQMANANQMVLISKYINLSTSYWCNTGAYHPERTTWDWSRNYNINDTSTASKPKSFINILQMA